MSDVATSVTFGVTIHSQTGEEVKIHDVECGYYQQAKNYRELTAEQAVTWLKNRPDDVCSRCIRNPAGKMPDNVETSEEVNHIVAPARLMNDIGGSKKVKAVCGQVIRHRSKAKWPICRKCFKGYFGK